MPSSCSCSEFTCFLTHHHCFFADDHVQSGHRMGGGKAAGGCGHRGRSSPGVWGWHTSISTSCSKLRVRGKTEVLIMACCMAALHMQRFQRCSHAWLTGWRGADQDRGHGAVPHGRVHAERPGSRRAVSLRIGPRGGWGGGVRRRGRHLRQGRRACRMWQEWKRHAQCRGQRCCAVSPPHGTRLELVPLPVHFAYGPTFL